MTPPPVRTAIVGCGMISSHYLTNCRQTDLLEVVACVDRDHGRAVEQAERFDIERACSLDAALADSSIELVVNLTVPSEHGGVALAALRAGKSVYNEKPLAVSRELAAVLLQEAGGRGLHLGSAPDTFLGAGLQTCRALIDSGEIGAPVAAMGFMLVRGPELWHPDPAFLYQQGAGPLFDMGPYYITALVSLLGPVRRVTGSARTLHSERTVRSGPKQGEHFPVETPTHVAAVLEFSEGAVASLVTSFDVSLSAGATFDLYGLGGGLLEIQGVEGTISLPDPDTFGGPVRLRKLREAAWRDMPLSHGHAEERRGIGIVDMARAMRAGGAHRANGELAYHVLDVMHCVLEAARTGRHVTLGSSCDRPAPLDPDFRAFTSPDTAG